MPETMRPPKLYLVGQPESMSGGNMWLRRFTPDGRPFWTNNPAEAMRVSQAGAYFLLDLLKRRGRRYTFAYPLGELAIFPRVTVSDETPLYPVA